MYRRAFTSSTHRSRPPAPEEPVLSAGKEPALSVAKEPALSVAKGRRGQGVRTERGTRREPLSSLAVRAASSWDTLGPSPSADPADAHTIPPDPLRGSAPAAAGGAACATAIRPG